MVIYPESHRLVALHAQELREELGLEPPIGAIVVTVKPGQALYFRTDLLHQGNGYSSRMFPRGNCRLHCFAVSKDPFSKKKAKHYENKINVITDPLLLSKLTKLT